ncbi:hypothetical protein [Nocardioides sp. W7]|uniref:hypothetical protein n=1 Tax=Nocardioides sp. W7 TaxID=2931390 RepID=UPI001FCF992C|nr:hypothetical protein [Nocardioides sp. W7]
MIALLRVELTRLRWRRAVWLLVAACVVVPTIIAISAILTSRPPSADELARIEQQVAEEREQPYVQEELQTCLDEPGQYGVDPESAGLQAECEEMVLPQVEWYGGFEQLSLRDQMDFGDGLVVVTVLTLLLMLAGTTFIGHDWSSGSMSNQLLFESRRSRIWAAKGVVVTLMAFLTATVVSSAYWLALWAVVRSRDLPSGTGLLLDCLQFGLRGALFAAAAALGGFVLTMLFRSTVATVGVLFALSVGGGALIAVLGLAGNWQPGPNLEAIVKNGTTYFVEVPEHCYDQAAEGPEPLPDSVCDEEQELSLGHGAAYYGVLLLGGSVLSGLSFARRDVP